MQHVPMHPSLFEACYSYISSHIHLPAPSTYTQQATAKAQENAAEAAAQLQRLEQKLEHQKQREQEQQQQERQQRDVHASEVDARL